MRVSYPLRIDDQRTLPDGYDGPVFVWDIDKTYLSTHFSSLQGLSRIPLEFAVDKRAITGMPEVLRGIRRGPGPGYGCVPLYFVTASPPQLRGVLEHKMILDGVEFDGITFKDWWRIMKQGRPKRLLDQVGFKVCALLEGRQRRPLATEYLFGDDAESDADAFSLYASMLQNELPAREAQDRMAEAGVREDNRRCVLSLLDQLPRKRGNVGRFFIHLEKQTPPEKFDRFGPLVAPVRNGFQLSLALYELGLVDQDTVLQCREAASSAPGSPGPMFESLITDAIDRRLITRRKLHSLDAVLPTSLQKKASRKGTRRAGGRAKPTAKNRKKKK
jgi:hypothetical protein